MANKKVVKMTRADKHFTKAELDTIDAVIQTPTMERVGLFVSKLLGDVYSSQNAATVGLADAAEVTINGKPIGIKPLDVMKDGSENAKIASLVYLVQSFRVQSKSASLAVALEMDAMPKALREKALSMSGLTSEEQTAFVALTSAMVNWLNVQNKVDLRKYSESAKGATKADQRSKIIVTPIAGLTF